MVADREVVRFHPIVNHTRTQKKKKITKKMKNMSLFLSVHPILPIARGEIKASDAEDHDLEKESRMCSSACIYIYIYMSMCFSPAASLVSFGRVVLYMVSGLGVSF